MEKKYEEALERARMEYNADVTHGTKNVLETVFPELKESEDERIRKSLIDILKNDEKCYLKEIAWLERQGEKHIDKELSNLLNRVICRFINDPNIPYFERYEVSKKIIPYVEQLERQGSHYTFEIKKGHWYKCVCDYILNGSDLIFKNGRFYYCRSDWRLGERNVKDIGVNGYKSFFRPATNQEVKDWLEKQGEQKPAKNIVESWKDMRLEVYQQASGNRHEPNCSDDDTKMFSLNDIDEIIEKISEQKPADKVEPKFHEGDTIINIHYKWDGNTRIREIKDGKYIFDGGGFIFIEEQGLWKLVEQKPADKVKSKFKVDN